MMLPETNIGSRPPGPAFGLLVGVLAVVAATAVRLALDPVVVGVPFIPYVLAVVVAGWIGGRPAGLLALGGSVLAADYFFLEPRHSFAIASTQGRVSAVVFIVITSCLLAVVFAWRRNRALLLRSQTVFAQAGQMGRLGAWAVDVSKPETLESNALYWSDETYRIFGYQPRAVRVSNALFFSRVHPEDRERVNQAMAQALATRKPYEIEHRIVHPDGSERTVHEHAEIEFDRTGRPRWIIGAVQDITEQRRTEQTLREASDRLRRILEHIHDALIIDDIDGRLVFANDRFLAMFGFDRSEVGSLRLEDYVAPEHRELLRDRHGRRVRGEEVPTQFEYIGLHRDGRRMWVEVDIVPVLDDGGMVIGTQSALRDVTDRKLAEDALRASEETARWRAEELEKLMDVVPTAIWVAHDPECRTITGNRAARHFYDARGGRNVSAGPVGGDQDGTHRFFRDGAELTPDTLPMREAAAKGIEIRDAELQVLLPSGRTITILGNATPLFDADQRTRGCIGAFMDITERKRLEQELRQNAEQLAEANRLKDEFIATVSHELRTPLNAMLGWAELLRERRLGAAAEARALQVISSNARRQAQLIEDLLDMSRIVAGKLRLDPRPIDPTLPVAAAIEAVLPSAAAKGVAVRPPAATAEVRVFADAARLQQVVWNLLTNAVKFTPHGGEVRVDIHPRAGEVDVIVRDTGIGIRPEFLPHVFDRFRQADSRSTRTHGGLGIGLSIVRHLVEAQGGHVRAESGGENQGSTFVVTLPVQIAFDDVRPAQAPASHARQDDWQSLEGTRVLAVDDEADARELIAAMLSHHGAEVRTAESVDDALDTICRWAPDVLVVDIAMPIADGFALLRRLREIGGSASLIPAIALTAYAREEDRQRGLESGFGRYLTKPVDEAALLEAVSASNTSARG